jgi:hypothetical protein
MAFYRADGSLNTSFAAGQTLADIRSAFHALDLMVDDAGIVRWMNAQ